MSHHRWAAAFRKIRYRFGKVWYTIDCTFKATLSMFSYNRAHFLAHYHGRDTRDSLEDFFDWLKWEYKAGHTLDPWETREKLAQILEDRGASW
jgi:hypothetical protein